MSEIPREYKPMMEEIIEKRIKERDTEIWARGINGVLSSHTEAITDLTKEVHKLALILTSDTTERAAATALRLGVPMLTPAQGILLTELLAHAEENQTLEVVSIRRGGILHNRLVRVGLVLAVVLQVIGIAAAVYNSLFGVAHPIRIGP